MRKRTAIEIRSAYVRSFLTSEVIMARKKQEPSTRYYRWEGDACRIHVDEYGTETADIYRAGKGMLRINPVDVQFGAVQVGRADYDELVLEEDERFTRLNTQDGTAQGAQS
jgi:hypothetical protein